MLHTIPLGIVSSTAAAYLIEQSLLFNDDDSAYLSRTPSTAGNRKTWTFSAWVKLADPDATLALLSAGDGTANNFTQVFIRSDDFRVTTVVGGVSYTWTSDAAFKDPSSWGNFVVTQDTTASSGSRLIVKYNGVILTGTWGTEIPLNTDTFINSTNVHYIGARDSGAGAANFFDGLIALPILVDGAALDATSFGETDDDGFWNPIEFTGATTTTDNVSVGGTASAETTFLTYVPANAFDGNTSTRWISSATPSWLEYDRGSGNGVISTSYSISCGPSGTASTADMPKNWTIEGYNGASWDTLATVTGEPAWSLGETRLYTFTNTTSYEKYRIDITLQQGGGAEIEVGELRFYAAGTGYGQNGFQLDFADTSDFGADVNYTGDTSVTFTDSSVDSGSATTYTFSSQAIGTASADRVVVVGTSGGAGATNPVSSMTIGGVSAVKAIGIVNSTGTEIWYATVTSGTTASVVVNWGGTKSRCGIGVWALTGVTGVGATNTSTSSTATLTVSGKTKDIVLAVYGGKDHASVTFTGLTEDYDEDISGAGSQYQAGGSKKLTATGSNTITVTPNTGATEVAAVSAVFLATGNNGYVSNNFTASDQLEDTPTDSAADGIGNFSTLNPNDQSGSVVLSEGNLTATIAPSAWNGIRGTIGSGSGKVYFEVTDDNGDVHNCSGMASAASILTNSPGTATQNSLIFNTGDYYEYDGTLTASTATTTGQIRGHAFDLDTGEAWYAINNVWQNSGDPSAGTGAIDSSLPTDGTLLFPVFRGYSSSALTFNFGQKPFAYTPPTGFSALATQNLLSDNPLYTGNAAQYRVGAPIINPFTDLPNAIHGWRADLGLSLTGSSVDQWDDQIGSWNLVDGGTKPTVLSSNINGLDAISFPGDGGNLSVSGVTLTMPYTVLMVMKQITWMLYGYPFGVFTQKGLQQRPSSPSLMQGDNLANTNSAATVGSYFPIMAEFGNTTSDFLQIGDTKVGGTASGNSSISSSTFMLGAAQASPPSNRSANVAYAEFIIVEGAISEFDLANYRAYVKDRYGV